MFKKFSTNAFQNLKSINGFLSFNNDTVEGGLGGDGLKLNKLQLEHAK